MKRMDEQTHQHPDMNTNFNVRMFFCMNDGCMHIWMEQRKKFNVNMKIVKCFLAADAKNAFISLEMNESRTTENGMVQVWCCNGQKNLIIVNFISMQTWKPKWWRYNFFIQYSSKKNLIREQNMKRNHFYFA